MGLARTPTWRGRSVRPRGCSGGTGSASGIGSRSTAGTIRRALVSLFATTAIGAAWVPIHPARPEDEVRSVLEDSGARLLIRASPATHPDVGIPELEATEFDGLARRRIRTLPAWEPASDDVAILAYTSGTTGSPKGVILSHGNLLWDVDPDGGGVCDRARGRHARGRAVHAHGRTRGHRAADPVRRWKGRRAADRRRCVGPRHHRASARDGRVREPRPAPGHGARSRVERRRPVERSNRRGGRRPGARAAAPHVPRQGRAVAPRLRAHRGGPHRLAPRGTGRRDACRIGGPAASVRRGPFGPLGRLDLRAGRGG